MLSTKSIFIRLLLLVFLLFIAWRVFVLGMSEHYVELALSGDDAAIDKALSWNANHPKALYLKAMQIKTSRPDQAIALLRQAINENPAEGRALIELAHLLRDKNQLKEADWLAGQGVKLLPAYASVRIQAANYWIFRGKWDKAMENWRAALVTDALLGSKIFPLMLQVVESGKGGTMLKVFADNPPVWWGGFFEYVARNSASLKSLVAIAMMRQASDVPLSAEERKHLVERLIKEKQWPQAYLVWFNGLSSEQRKHLGGIYNGGFEQEITNSGFDWRLLANKKLVSISRKGSYGVQGDKALHLMFKGEEFHFRHLWQLLFRGVGTHEFIGKYRVDRLRGRGGLKWAVYCAGDQSQLLGESKIMLGLGEWELVSFKFTVPNEEACVAQLLRLESTGKTPFDNKLEGEIWLDGLSIRSLRRSNPVELSSGAKK
ncbi:MAG TPA: tetratricopeptide repeat protein [Thiolapillus brandeum]|uniref:Tetratricopeptide repeat protein n=1 Tax=Thiolapillus brandeum TaxID=1076588 RepID=A0A831NZ31_9GAMM|nr:tetratricopeptide repeat protein [Thiolapillus brandeum]